MNKKQIRDLVERVLIGLDLHRPEAVELILGTIAQESHNGEYIRQLGNGPALGICQMEPATFRDIVNTYLGCRPDLAKRIISVTGVNALRSEYLEYNLALSIAMCRVHYLRVKEAIPQDLIGWARYWKKYYNTASGRGTEVEFVKNFNKFVL